MFETIRFYIHGKTLEINSREYSLGELTTDFLNISPEEYAQWKKLYDKAETAFEKYKTGNVLSDWWEANEALIKLDRLLKKRKVFQAVETNSVIFDEAKEFTGQLSINEPDIDLKIPLMIYEKNLYCYGSILHDIRAFNTTIHYFINNFLSDLKNLNSNNYAMAYYEFINHPRREKFIANPVSSNDIYLRYEHFTVEYEPWEYPKDSGQFQIVEAFEVGVIQSLIRTDFLKALMAGFIIRRCEHCKKYFLLKKGYHTRYCDNPAPENPECTCQQMGYRNRGRKELTADSPKHNSMTLAFGRIEKDYSRKIITAEDRDALFALARDLYNEANTSSKWSNDEFDALLQTKTLYARLNIARKTKPRGRPKKEIS